MMFALAHLSDPHLSPMPRPRLVELMGKRAVGYFNWRSNRGAHHSPDFLSALVADLKHRGFDHLAVTGDLVNLGLPDEYALARRFLESLGPGDRVSMVPGNHDAYVRGTALLHIDLWKDYIAGDEPAQDSGIAAAATSRSSDCRPRSRPRLFSQPAGSARRSFSNSSGS